MGFEIKNICTVVPNPNHPNYKKNGGNGDGYFYFSLFITPRLQFDGKLKEFYEMLHWPEYVEKIFYPTVINAKKNIKISENIEDKLTFVNLVTSTSERVQFFIKENIIGQISLEKDYSFLAKMYNIEDIYERSHLLNFLEEGKKIWRKLFPENVPVEAWPIYLKPQIYNATTSTENNDEIKNTNEGNLSQSSVVSGDPNIEVNFDSSNTENENKTSKERKNLKEEKFNSSKYRQEFHKKISALSRYPHVLRLLGLIQDFKICADDVNITFDKENRKKFEKLMSPFLLKLNIDTRNLDVVNTEIDFLEFRKSVQFFSPYTKCEFKHELKRLRAYYIQPKDDPSLKAGYDQYVNGGFLNNRLKKIDKNGISQIDLSGIPVYEVNQDYFEDRTQDFGNINKLETGNSNNQETPKVVGMSNVYPVEDIEILKQKKTGQSQISKGFAIKVHSQPGNLLTGMDEKLKGLTDDNIEKAESAFMGHHLDCGYRVDVNVIHNVRDKNNYVNSEEIGFLSLCKREAEYVVDRKALKIGNPFSKKDINLPLTNTPLFKKKFEDEPWLEEVRLINNEGGEDRFEEIARWMGWSLTCPPLYNRNNNDEGNMEADVMELLEVKPPERSLPKLRFGNDYEYLFRIRTVDICGNGPDLCDPADDSCIFKCMPDGIDNLSYKRLESINPPKFFATYALVPDLANATDQQIREKKKGGDGFNINKLYKGEDNETLVIRTKLKKDGSLLPVNDECIRYITPPYVTMNFAETSGTLDNLFNQEKGKERNLKEYYKFLAAVPKNYYDKDEIENKIPFLFDCKVKGVKIFEKHPDTSETSIGRPQVYNTKDVLNTAPLKLILNFEKKSSIKQKEIFPIIHPGDYRTYKIESVNLDGPESEGKEFRMIHAVQKPCFKQYRIPNNEVDLSRLLTFKKLVPDNSFKEEQKYKVYIDLVNKKNEKNKFPFTTTGELVLLASYNDYELNPKNPNGWSYISREFPKQKGDKLLEGINEDHGTDPVDCLIKDADKFNLRNSWSNLDESTENDKLDTIFNDDDPLSKLLDTNTENLQLFNKFSHNFPDAKYRKVKYQLQANSKFSEFFDIEKHNIDTNDKNPFSTFGDFGEPIIIENSAKPSKPIITSIVPIFTTNLKKEKNRNTYTFEHRAFRIYLGDTWYETGLGEKISVIFKKQNPETVEQKNIDFNKISFFAYDPTSTDSLTQSKPIKNVEHDSIKVDKINRDYSFIDNVTKHPLYGENVSFKDILNVSLFPVVQKEGNAESPSTEDVDNVYDFSKFEVEWDLKMKQFYADIELKATTLIN